MRYDPPPYESIQEVDPELTEECPRCLGTGEGQSDWGSCDECRGSGVTHDYQDI